MRVVWHEIRHIFRPGTLVLLLVFNLLFYWMYIGFSFEHFPNGRPSSDQYAIQRDVVERFGSRVDEQEFKIFKREYEEKRAEADRLIAEDPEFAKYGLDNYEQYRTREAPLNALDLHIGFYDRGGHSLLADLLWELQSREWLIEWYESGPETEILNTRILNSDPQALEVVQQRIDNESLTSTQSYIVFDYYKNVLHDFSLLALVSVLAITIPLFLRDRRNGLLPLQYSSLSGRKVFGKKIAAALCSAFLVIGVQTVVLAVLFSQKGIELFYPLELHSYWNPAFASWYNFTFIEFIALTVAAVYIVCLLAVLAAAFLSSVLPNYMAMIGSLALLVILFIYWGRRLLITNLTGLEYDRLTQPLLYAGLILLLLSAIRVRWHREKQTDVA